MSDEERDNIDSKALLEFENAKKDWARLRNKTHDWRGRLESVGTLLDYSQRNTPEGAKLAIAARARLEEKRAALAEFLNLDAILALDDELRAAVERLGRAEAVKRELGFG